MTKKRRKDLLWFITHTAMFVCPVDDKTITSFVHGYEFGASKTYDFTEQLSQLISNRHKIHYGSLGWPGQVTQLSSKLGLSWPTTFRRLALDIVMGDSLSAPDADLSSHLKSYIVSGILRLRPIPPPWIGQHWIDDWQSLCVIKTDWFKALWTDEELKIIKSVDRHVRAGKVFSEEDSRLPTASLLKLKARLEKITKSNENL